MQISIRQKIVRVTAVAYGFAFISLLACSSCDHRTGSSLPVYGEVPDFHLVERSAALVSRADFAGSVWIANFIFTRCPGVCPLLSTRMARLQRTLPNAANDQVRLVSFSVDPQWDTPQRLQTYARHYDADAKRWLFLTGEVDAVRTLVSKGFQLAMAQPSEQAKPAALGEVVHSDRFVLVDRRLRIRGYYHGSDGDALEQLRRDAVLLYDE
jgi:protein SCO1